MCGGPQSVLNGGRQAVSKNEASERTKRPGGWNSPWMYAAAQKLQSTRQKIGSRHRPLRSEGERCEDHIGRCVVVSIVHSCLQSDFGRARRRRGAAV